MAKTPDLGTRILTAVRDVAASNPRWHFLYPLFIR